VINSPGDHHFRAILDVIGRPDLKDDPRLVTRSARVQNFELVDELLEAWTRGQTRNEAADKLLARAVPCAPVRNLREVMADRNMHARGSLQWVDHPELGRVPLPHTPLTFEGVPRPPLEPSLPLGACSEEIVTGWLGRTQEEFEALRAQGVVGATLAKPA
jgi:CoA:oxalate CoA-transferase